MKSKNNNNKSDDSDDDQSQASNEVNTDNSPKYIPIAKLGDKPKTKKIVINISDTQYPIVEQVAQELGWVVQKTEGAGDWDVWWTDREIEPNTLFRMNLHQKINHFPGIYILARKNLFGLGLMSMRQHYPDEYNFFPETWTIPMQFSQFRHYYENIQKGKARTYIVKPQALSQGRGIFLTRNIEDILNGNKYVIQRYIKNPLLIDKLKFDLRIYVLLAGTDPLRLYIYSEGLTRFATQGYQEPTNQNLNRSYIHLTNYSLNKSNPNYIFNTSDKDMDKGHKRTLSSTYQRLAKNGVDVQGLKLSIQDAIIKSVISGLPSIRHQYKYCQPQEYEGGMCFHILGFDVMLTDDLKPIVIEVNHTPSFQTGTPLDYLVKKNLIKDTLKLMRISQKNKRKLFERAKEIAKMRLETGKRQIFKGKERQEIIKKARQERDHLQKDFMGGYKRIFPPYDEQMQIKYNKFYETAHKINRDDNEVRKKLLNQEKKQQQNKRQLKRPQEQRKKDKEKDKEIDKDKSTPIDKALQKNILDLSGKTHNQLPALRQQDKQIISPKQTNTGEHSRKRVQPSQDYPLHRETFSQQVQQDRSDQIDDKKRNNFRTKISRKNHPNLSSNQQLVKYTESIKKFNELMVKFMVEKEGQELIPADMDLETFQMLKQKLHINRATKNHSQNNPTFAPFGSRESRPTKSHLGNGLGIGNLVIHQTGLVRDLKLQVRNGSFLKPKNYLLSEERSNVNHNKQRRSQDQIASIQQTRQMLLGGIIIENKSSKAYSKLLKNPASRGIIPLRR